MNDLGLIVVGVAIRASVVAVAGLVASMALRRRGPEAGALIASTTLAVLVGVSALALAPWPPGPGGLGRTSEPEKVGDPSRPRLPGRLSRLWKSRRKRTTRDGSRGLLPAQRKKLDRSPRGCVRSDSV